MSIRSTQILGVLALVLVLAAVYVAKFGFYPRYFDIEWDEEVQLHDGRMIVVHVKRTFERQGLRLERYPEHPRQLSMYFRFDRQSGKPFEHTFKRGGLHFLDEKDGSWYIGYHADPGDPSVEIGSRNIYPHVAIINPDGTIRKPSSWADIPSEITRANILPATPNPKVVADFQGQRLTNARKMAHWNSYPTGAGYGKIHRITPQTNSQEGKK